LQRLEFGGKEEEEEEEEESEYGFKIWN